jgi:hypothetical protein
LKGISLGSDKSSHIFLRGELPLPNNKLREITCEITFPTEYPEVKPIIKIPSNISLYTKLNYQDFPQIFGKVKNGEYQLHIWSRYTSLVGTVEDMIIKLEKCPEINSQVRAGVLVY